MTMFARRRDVLEREADRIGALAVRGDVTLPQDLERAVAKTSRPSAASTSSSGTRAARPPARALDVTPDALEQAVELMLAPRGAARPPRLPHLEKSAGGRHRRDHVARREGADAPSRALEHVPPGDHRLAEDTRRRARPARDHGQLRRARPHRDAAARAALPGRADTGAARRDPAAAAGATPREFGDVVCFLASDRARYVSGQTIVVDGGLQKASSDGRRLLPPASSRATAVVPRSSSRRSCSIACRRTTISCCRTRRIPSRPLVTVQGGHKPTGAGGIYFVDVFERRASVFESLFPWIHSGATLVPASLIVPPGVERPGGATGRPARDGDLAEGRSGGRAAPARVQGRRAPSGVIVAELESASHAVGKLQAGDVIVARQRRADADDRAAATAMREGEAGRRRRARRSAAARSTLTIHVKTMRRPADKKRAIVGFAPEQAARIKLPIKVRINAGNVGGPSAGLAFALEVMEKLGHNVDRGYRVAATGRDRARTARSTAIGGVKQKTFGAHEAESRRLPRPVAGDNARDARALRAWPPHHPCEEFSTGVARSGNTAPETVGNGSFRQVRNCRKFVSFRSRQRLHDAHRALVSRRVAPRPSPEHKDK